MSDEALQALADAAGIEPRYWDIRGRLYERSPETARHLLRALRIPSQSDADIAHSLRALAEEPWREMIPPVVVGRDSENIAVAVRLDARLAPHGAQWSIEREDGERVTGEFRLDALPAGESRELDGATIVLRRLDLPPQPPGYHRLRVALGSECDATLIVAPMRCYLPPEPCRVWGLSAQLYALRSRTDWGIGDFGGLGELVAWAASHKADFIALNPLHALFWDAPESASPYSPSSRLFCNPLYLDVPAIADFVPPEPTFHQGDAVRTDHAPSYVEYRAVASFKNAALRQCYARFAESQARTGDARARAFESFLARSGPELERFATFQALSGRFGSHDWLGWPGGFRDPDSADVERFRRENGEEVRFFQYLQWQCEEQLATVAARAQSAAMRLGLYGDLAVGTAAASADHWGAQRAFLAGISVGAPPDPFNERGQEWGVAPFDPRHLRASAYRDFAGLLRANMRHAGVLRVDHVMGWERLFVIPAGAKARDGAYLRYPLRDLTAIAALESRRHRCVVVGEDLGTVRAGFREEMAAAGILSCRVLYFEKDLHGFRKPAELPHLAVASATTHDLATLRGYWTCEDIAAKSALGIIGSAEGKRQLLRERADDKRQLVRALRSEGLLPPGEEEDDVAWTAALANAIHAYLAKTPCMLVVAQLDDIAGERQQVNLPGTAAEYPNWRRRLSRTIEDLRPDPAIGAAMEAMARTASIAR